VRWRVTALRKRAWSGEPAPSPYGPGKFSVAPGPTLTGMRAVQITRFGGPEVLDVVDLPDPTPGDGEQLFDVSSCGVNLADTHHCLC
jgi:hypothetical protein